MLRVYDTHNVYEFSINGNTNATGITNGWDYQYNYVTLNLQTLKNNYPGTITLGYRGKTWTIVIITPQTLTLDPFGTYCSNDSPFTLTGGSPAGGYYTVNGSTASTFDPSHYGAGSHDVQYKFYDGCTTPSPIQKIVVEQAPVITFNNINSVCIYTDPFTLTQAAASPAGGTGTYSGPGVSGNMFYPAVAGVGTFTITYTYKYGNCQSSATQTVKVYDKPVVNFSGLDATGYCNNGNPEFLTGNHVPSGSFTGQGIADNGNGTATFNPQSLTAGSNTTVTYTYADPASGCKNEISKTTSILPLPTAHISGTQTVCSGSTTTLNVDFSGTGPFDFTYSDGVSNTTITNVNVNPYTLSVSPTVTTSYTIVSVTQANGCSQTGTGQGNVTIIPQTEIINPLSDLTVCQGGTAIFNIKAKGDNVSYLWKKNGIDAGTGDFLVLNNINLSDNNSDIYCEVTSTCGGTVISNHAKLYVNPKTQITDQPKSMNNCTGNGVTLSVTTNGINNSYRWEKDGVVVNNIAGKISGSTEAKLTILNLIASDAGSYKVYVDGDCGTEVVSNPATLSVDDPIVITTQPSSVAACSGSNIALNVSATGTNLSYQWYFNDGSGFGPTGTGSQSLTIDGVSTTNVGTYYCIISSPCGASSTTNSVTLTIPAVTAISTDPVGGTICEGENFNFSVVATGDNLHYQWYKDGTLLTDNAIVSNSATSNLTLSGATTAYSGNYTVMVIGACGTEYRAVALSVKQSITFASQPVSQQVCTGSDATFSVNVNGDILAYQWQYNTNPIAGATGSSYTINDATSTDAGNYRCQIKTSDCGIFYSNEATLSVNPLTTITSQPAASKSACAGSNVSFAVAASGVALTYQWYKDGVSLGAGYTNATLIIPNITATDAGTYICYVTGNCGPTVISNSGVLTVDIPLVISNHPQSKSVCLNSSHELTVMLSSGTNPVYQWYFKGAPVGGNSQVYNIPSFTAADEGDYYCVIDNGCGTVTSQTATLKVASTFTVSGPVDVNVCDNGTASFTVSATASDVSYQWMRNGAIIAGATSSSLIINNITLADDGARYSCEVSNGCGTITSYAALLTVLDPLSITQQPQSG
ncbi:MAG TPA: immunoglobulin domain-containing protein, partial [Bacteroidales bacterium]|nr:immunoglobulin domain-containing protein [Bacteroidales bacterium]